MKSTRPSASAVQMNTGAVSASSRKRASFADAWSQRLLELLGAPARGGHPRARARRPRPVCWPCPGGSSRRLRRSRPGGGCRPPAPRTARPCTPTGTLAALRMPWATNTGDGREARLGRQVGRDHRRPARAVCRTAGPGSSGLSVFSTAGAPGRPTWARRCSAWPSASGDTSRAAGTPSSTAIISTALAASSSTPAPPSASRPSSATAACWRSLRRSSSPERRSAGSARPLEGFAEGVTLEPALQTQHGFGVQL